MAVNQIVLTLVFLSVVFHHTSLVLSLTLPNQVTAKPRHTKYSSSTAPPANAGVTKAATVDDKGVAIYRYVNRLSGATCILFKTDAVVEVKFRLHDLEEQADSFIPEKALVDGSCKNEDDSFMRISWTGYSLLLNFAKTPGGERWYISNIELAVSPELPSLHGIQTHGKPIKLYHKNMLIPTPVGRSYSCSELDIELQPTEEDHPPAGLRGSLLLRLIQLQPFMYKGEDFESPYACKDGRSFRDETAPLVVGLMLAIAVLMTIGGYSIWRYMKVKSVQYNTME